MKNNYSLSFLILGIFFLCFATNGYIIGGDIGKYLCLIFGFLLIYFGVGKIIVSRNSINFIIISISYYCLLFCISFFSNHEWNVINFLFGLISLVLLNLGYILSSNSLVFNSEPLRKELFIIPIFTLIGTFMLLRFQSQLVLIEGANNRGYGDESDLNPVGVSFVFGLLFIVNFVLFQKCKDLSRGKKILLIFAQTASIIAMITTLSRGALIFLILLIIFYFLFNFRLSRSKLIQSFGLVFSFIILTIIFISVSQYIPFIAEKSELIGKRFSGLIEFGMSTTSDNSSQERIDGYQFFWKNFDKFIFFGQEYYKPYPHNQFIEILMRWGLFGIPLLIFSISSLFKALKLFKFSSTENNLTIFFVVFLFLFSYFQSMTSLSLEMNRLLWFGFGFVFGQSIPKKNLVIP